MTDAGGDLTFAGGLLSITAILMSLVVMWWAVGVIYSAYRAGPQTVLARVTFESHTSRAIGASVAAFVILDDQFLGDQISGVTQDIVMGIALLILAIAPARFLWVYYGKGFGAE